MTSSVYLDSAEVVADFIASPAVTGAWDQPSALPEMSVAALAGHLARQVLNTPVLLSSPADGEPVSLLDHYLRSAWVNTPLDDPVNVGIRSSGTTEAADGPVVLAGRVRDAVAGLRATLPGSSGRTVFLPWAGWTLTLEDYLSTRLLEIVIHCDDLAVSVGVEPPELPEAATDATIVLLARLAVRRHGVAPVLRALARAERAPKSINAL